MSMSIYAPNNICVDIDKPIRFFVALRSNGNPVTDENFSASLFGESGLIETTTGTHITNGIYMFEFNDTETEAGYIYVVGSNYGVEAWIHLTRSEAKRYALIAKKILSNNWEIKDNQLIIYDDDGTTPLLTFNLYDKLGNPAEINVFKREKQT